MYENSFIGMKNSYIVEIKWNLKQVNFLRDSPLPAAPDKPPVFSTCAGSVQDSVQADGD